MQIYSKDVQSEGEQNSPVTEVVGGIIAGIWFIGLAIYFLQYAPLGG